MDIISTEKDPILKYKAYPKRWLVLAVLVVLNVAGALIWLTFTPVAYKAANYYDIDTGTLNLLPIVFMIGGVVIGLPATVVLEKYGLKVSLLISAWLTCIGGCLRIASTVESLPNDGKVAILFVGQTIAAIGQPFSMYAPAKTAAIWFPENQRALANTLGAVANPLGVVIGGLVCPLFVDAESGVIDMINLLIVTACPAALGALMASFTMTTAKPPIPPSAGAEKKNDVFGKGITKVLKNKNFVVLLISVGGAVGLYSSFATLLEQILCPFGYTDAMAGVCAAVMTALGIVGAAIVGIYCDKTKQFSTAVKGSFIVTTLGLVVFCIVFHINIGYLILILLGLTGLCSFGIYPIGVELGAEATYPVGIATSSGLMVLSGQIQSILLVLVLQSIGRKMTADEILENGSQCHSSSAESVGSSSPTSVVSASMASFSEATIITAEPEATYDLSLSVYVSTAYLGVLAFLTLIFFKPSYKRQAAERKTKDTDSNSESKIKYESSSASTVYTSEV